jgi:hypothetical protein
VDFEGDPFVGNQGLEYLFGFAARNANDEFIMKSDGLLAATRRRKGLNG